MFKPKFLFVIFFTLLFFACFNEKHPPAKKLKKVNLMAKSNKQGFDPLKNGFSCDSFNIQTVANKKFLIKLLPSLGETVIDTISTLGLKIHEGAEEKIIITDFNFDGFCDFVIPDEASASHGGMNYYYFLYDSTLTVFTEVKSLPKFNGGFKLDIKNQRVKIYCPNEDCFAYYKYQENGTFKLVKGEFKVNP